MAFYGSLGEVNFGNLDASIADTAVDVFVYDTRKDSDGGAWRNRTQHTSWYNETLNTATRGSRREFPAVAVIVASTFPNKVTVYDGDDPDLPMWMVFTSNADQYGAIFNNRSVVSIIAINGSIIWGDSSDSVADVSFIKDNYVSTAATGSWNSSRNILDRNPTDTSNLWTNYNSGRKLVSYPINDVAMTVLPNAPIDDATGLPIPTIAVATNGGVSVIKDDGNVYDFTFSGQNGNKVWEITFDKNYQICMLLGYSNVYPYTSYIHEVPSADKSLSTTTDRVLNNNTYNFPSDAYKADNTPGDFITAYIDSKYFGTTHGMSFLTPNKNDIGGQLIAHMNTSFNSGWMHGDIKGAFLSDTDATNVTGTELVTNGTFDTDSDWTKGTGWTIGSGVASHSGTAGYLTQSSVFTIGKYYAITFTVTGTTVLPGGSGVTPSNASYSSGTYTHYGYAIDLNLQFYSNATTTIDNISVRIADPDRSVNNNGLQVFGTINKSAVATGAELVGYSGFNSSNYLFQPYNSELDFGTGDFCYMCWVKDDSVSVGGTIFQRGPAVNTNETVFYINSSFRLIGRVSTNLNGLESDACFVQGSWNHCVFLRSGTTIQIYHNGKLVGSKTNTESMNQSGYGLSIGAWLTNNSYFPTSISLFRVSASVPSPEQIKKIYEDEKVLFQENAACTLYGSSDAVTALAYDEDTDLLHVGTSSGRSDFQGLRRINNTTTAVTTAISASDGLIVEQ